MEHLKELREQRHLLQKDVAKALSIDRTTYVKYERGKSEPNYEMLIRIALFYGVSVNYLLGFPEPTEEEKSILHDAKKPLLMDALVSMLSDFSQEKIQGLIDIACLPQEQFQLVLDFVSVLKAANKD